MTTALYRRYRPQDFAEVIGQEHVTEPLMQALRSGRVGHAYLFSGPRGCGKTTSARILARCLNCEQGPTATPCGVCDSCVALATGGSGSVDVIEIDAASHGGVDDARDLREKAAYGPAQSRFKVYIIDEAHMVTPQGFNALLKIVEEPPEHVKFVFATTEPEKVIGTIRSRTHHYPFRLVPPARLQDYLEELCQRENVQVEPGVLSFVVRAGGGSVRDSLSVLDQLIAGSDEAGLTYAGAAALLGFTENELLDACIDALAAGDGAGMFRQIDRVIETGQDPRRFVEDLLERFRDLIVLAAVSQSSDADASVSAVLRGLPEDQLVRMRQQAGVFGAGQLSYAADVVNAGLTEMTGATSPRLQLELLCARLLLPTGSGEHGYAARLDRLERRLEVGGGIASPVPDQGAQSAQPVVPAQSSAGDDQPGGWRDPRREARPDEAPGSDASEAASSGRAGPRRESQQERAPQRGPSGRAQSMDRSPAPDGEHPRGGNRQDPPHGPGTSAPASTSTADSTHSATSTPGAASAPTGQRPAGGGPRGGVDTEMIRRNWPDVLQRIFNIRRVTWTFLSEHAQVLDYDGTRLLLGLSTKGLATTFRNGPHGEVVRQALSEALGVDTRVEGIPASDAPPPRGGASATAGGGAPPWQVEDVKGVPVSGAAGPQAPGSPDGHGDPGAGARDRGRDAQGGDSRAGQHAGRDTAAADPAEGRSDGHRSDGAPDPGHPGIDGSDADRDDSDGSVQAGGRPGGRDAGASFTRADGRPGVHDGHASQDPSSQGGGWAGRSEAELARDRSEEDGGAHGRGRDARQARGDDRQPAGGGRGPRTATPPSDDDRPPPSDDDVPPDEESLPPDPGLSFSGRPDARAPRRNPDPTESASSPVRAGEGQRGQHQDEQRPAGQGRGAQEPPDRSHDGHGPGDQRQPRAGQAGQRPGVPQHPAAQTEVAGPGDDAATRPAHPGAQQAREAIRAARNRGGGAPAQGGDPGRPEAARSHDEAASVDDEDIADAGTVGQPVIADVLGGVVIREEEG